MQFQRLEISGHAPELPLYCAIKFTSLDEVLLVGGMDSDLVGIYSCTRVDLKEQKVEPAVMAFPFNHGLWFHAGNFIVDDEGNFTAFGLDNFERYFLLKITRENKITMEQAFAE